MGIVADIGRTYREGPAPVTREHLARGVVEARSLAFLMIGCFLVFLAQWPRHARTVQETGRRTRAPRRLRLPRLARDLASGLLLPGWVTYGVSRALGGQGTTGTARLAMFWSWVAASPLALLAGVLGGLLGPRAADLAGILWIALFAAFWWLSQREAARGPVVHGV
jgi:hypothetical protein